MTSPRQERKVLPPTGIVTAGVFELFKIGVGPSSSHTMGPMIAARAFADCVINAGHTPERVQAVAFGSLAWTGKGHRTDQALILGLAGYQPHTFDAVSAKACLQLIENDKSLSLLGKYRLEFSIENDIVFDKKSPPNSHPNSMRFEAFASDGKLIFGQDWVSPGGGFVRCLGNEEEVRETTLLVHKFSSGAELLEIATSTGKSFAKIALDNELARADEQLVLDNIDQIVDVMFASIDEGLNTEGILPGGLKVRRRAKSLLESLQSEEGSNLPSPTRALDFVAAFAMAVNEVNAAGGRVVTAPTNGAAGVVPSVLRYYHDFCEHADRKGMRAFILTAAIIGAIIKHRASISGAEVGCQGEVGSASAMAAAGLCAALGGSNAQIENAAEIALEHHLGMTCDPIGGLVQIPCIERNAFGASKAIAAASLALRGDGIHSVSFDQVVETMRQTGLDMRSKYKETSRGGLAANVPEC